MILRIVRYTKILCHEVANKIGVKRHWPITAIFSPLRMFNKYNDLINIFFLFKIVNQIKRSKL